MPREGFKSITVSETVYDKLFNEFEKIREPLKFVGVNSFSGFCTFLMSNYTKQSKLLELIKTKQEESFHKIINETRGEKHGN